ncbi:hypothetical protein DH2020_032198 [Rehmannia glutinosa]|uniref:protein-S-isoprenylcysteine alpha-carbonyl methylesterase n=1 Tax=Rehmannia glutinosa TaxID=99300 RepID=A0ABR0VFY1_REHGL
MLLRSEDDLDIEATRILIPESFKDAEAKPLISRTLSYTDSAAALTANLNLNQKQRRRRVAGDTSLSAGGRQSFRQMGRAASDTYLITRLSFKLLRYLGLESLPIHFVYFACIGGIAVEDEIPIAVKVLTGLTSQLIDTRVGYRWITRFLALGCYGFLLIPGFFQVGYYYFFSDQIRRGVVYGDLPRNRLDLYLPKNKNGTKPVVAFVTGGAWIIGYKAWGSLLGQHLSERDVIVACIDYRNFPQGTIGDMVKDASQGISFVCNNIAEYGGDPSRIYLMGRSAGAHIAACALLEQAIKEDGERRLLGVCDFSHLHSIMEGEESLRRYSPELVVQDPNTRNAVSLLPPTILFHGTADYSIPADSSFAETLRSLDVQAESILYEERHTQICFFRYLAETDPMRGGRDDMFEDLVAMIHAGDSEAVARDATAPPRKRLVPEFMLKLARSISPF